MAAAAHCHCPPHKCIVYLTFSSQQHLLETGFDGIILLLKNFLNIYINGTETTGYYLTKKGECSTDTCYNIDKP